VSSGYDFLAEGWVTRLEMSRWGLIVLGIAAAAIIAWAFWFVLSATPAPGSAAPTVRPTTSERTPSLTLGRPLRAGPIFSEPPTLPVPFASGLMGVRLAPVSPARP
jgi:hypothetical protein